MKRGLHYALGAAVLMALVLAPARGWAQKSGSGRGGGSRDMNSGPLGNVFGSTPPPSSTRLSGDEAGAGGRKGDPVYQRQLEDLANARWAPVSILAVDGAEDSVEVTALDRALRRHHFVRLHRGDTTSVWVNAPTPGTKLEIIAMGPEPSRGAKGKWYSLAASIDDGTTDTLGVKAGKDYPYALSDATRRLAHKPQHIYLDLPYGKHKVMLILGEGPGEYVYADFAAWQLLSTEQAH